MSGENRANRNLVSHQWQELCLKLTTFPLSNKHTQIHLHTHGDGTNAQLAVVSDWHWQGWRFAGRSHRRHPNDFGAQGLEQVTRLITIHHLSTPKTKKKILMMRGPHRVRREKGDVVGKSKPTGDVIAKWFGQWDLDGGALSPLSLSLLSCAFAFFFLTAAGCLSLTNRVGLFIYALEKKKGFCVGWEKAKEKDKEMACREVSLLPVGQPFVRPRKGQIAECRLRRTVPVVSSVIWDGD
jgi:hypothetical protein